MLTYVLISVIVLLSIVLALSIFYVIKFGIIILNVTDALEESLEILDEREESIAKVLEIPLFYDSPEIRRVLEDVKQSRNAILYIANQLSRVEGYKNLEETSDTEDSDIGA